VPDFFSGTAHFATVRPASTVPSIPRPRAPLPVMEPAQVIVPEPVIESIPVTEPPVVETAPPIEASAQVRFDPGNQPGNVCDAMSLGHIQLQHQRRLESSMMNRLTMPIYNKRAQRPLRLIRMSQPAAVSSCVGWSS
jgi:hypothetical protein